MLKSTYQKIHKTENLMFDFDLELKKLKSKVPREIDKAV